MFCVLFYCDISKSPHVKSVKCTVAQRISPVWRFSQGVFDNFSDKMLVLNDFFSKQSLEMVCRKIQHAYSAFINNVCHQCRCIFKNYIRTVRQQCRVERMGSENVLCNLHHFVEVDSIVHSLQRNKRWLSLIVYTKNSSSQCSSFKMSMLFFRCSL